MAHPRVKKAPLTHFLCLPLINPGSQPQLQVSLESFREAVSKRVPSQDSSTTSASNSTYNRTNDTATINPQAIRPVGTLHLTLGVMSLDRDQLDQAVVLLKSLTLEKLLMNRSNSTSTISTERLESSSLQQEGLEPLGHERPIGITLQGLVSMHPPQQTSILYCTPSDPTARLQHLSLRARGVFREHGHLVPDDRPLKLHATVVNTIYVRGQKRARKTDVQKVPRAAASMSQNPFAPAVTRETHDSEEQSRVEGHGLKADAPLKMDARSLLETYAEFVWAKDVTLDRLAICEMGTKKMVDGQGRVIGEAYTEVASVSLLP